MTHRSPSPWISQVKTYVDPEGRPHHYIYAPHDGASTLVVHFSAFFGDWGDLKPYRHDFQGYFHRLRMFADVPDHNWLFLCDEYGADRNGTYYCGEAGDFFVERAMTTVLDSVTQAHEHPPSRIVTIGSSMGATAALKFGLMRRCLGIVAIAPHVDLDVCAARQGRSRHVGFICPDGDPMSEMNYQYTRQIRNLLATGDAIPPPRLFMQTCRDDVGVYPEQVIPLEAAWRAAGGAVSTDVRDSGGHTSDWATKALLLDVVDRMFRTDPFPVETYRTLPPYVGKVSKITMAERLRGRARRELRRLRRSVGAGR